MLKRSAATFRVILGFSHYASGGRWDDSIPLQNAFSIPSPFGNRLRRVSEGTGAGKETGAGEQTRTVGNRDECTDLAATTGAIIAEITTHNWPSLGMSGWDLS